MNTLCDRFVLRCCCCCFMWLNVTTIKKIVFAYLPAFSSSHLVRRGRCIVTWALFLWASESDRCSDLDSLPIHQLARNRNGQ